MTNLKERISGVAFHCHHDVLCEFVWDYDERVEFIKTEKPKEEQALRLRLFKMIPPDLTPKKGLAALIKAEAAFYYYKANKAELERLHARLCPNCPWDGRTIFGGE